MESKYNIDFDKEIPKILWENKISIIFSTYQAGRLMIIGSSDGYNLQQIPIPFKKPMGITIKGKELAVAGLDEICFFSSNENVVKSIKNNYKNIDHLYIYRGSYNTSSIDIHDISYGENEIWGVNTLFSCLCKFDLSHNFVPKWKPNFISDIAPEDRCHLNGLAMLNGKPKYVTALSDTNIKEGWRKDIMNSGVVIDVEKNEIIIDGLSMPHSPTIVNDELYVLESGNGRLIKINTEKKTFDVIYQFNKFVRGMKHYGGVLFIGLSKIRESSKTFNDLDVIYSSKNAGLIVFDLRTKTPFGKIIYNNTIEEIYDVDIIEGYCNPAIITRINKKSKNIIVTPKNIYWRTFKEKNQEEDSEKN